MTAHRKTLAVELATIMVAVLAYGAFLTWQHLTPAATTTPTVSAVTTPPTRAELLRLVNLERQKAGVAPLVDDPRLDQSAQRKADDMVKNNYYGHISPIDGKHGYEYINDVGISCKTDSENITGALTSSDAIQRWDSSKLHHEAMINPSYSLTGLGIVFIKDIPASRTVTSEPTTTDITNSFIIVEHFCQQ